jgi:hypothetical protein
MGYLYIKFQEMKSLRFIGLVVLGLVLLMGSSCQQESELQEVLVAKPITMTKDAFKSSVKSEEPRQIILSGKIYAYGNFIFINEPYLGLHVIDNTDPSAPQKIRFINIPGNVDLSIKDDYLFVDSLNDLVVLDISDISNIRPVARLENVLHDNIPWPFEADIIESSQVDYNSEIIVGWTLETELRSIEEVNQNNIFLEGDVLMATADSAGGTGEGGSMARFKIVGDYLYAVDNHNINVFGINDLEAPKELESVFAGFDIETIFNRGEHLFLGSRSGMYIYNITAPESPKFVSEFQHGTACDPVVVDDQYAYVTLRGGNDCGATESGLFIIDITDLEKPVQVASYKMDGPYGLGVKDNLIFVCDGDSGLKVFDKTDVLDLKSVSHFQNIITYDVIPLDSHLLMIGDKTLYQYAYEQSSISLLSSFSLGE